MNMNYNIMMKALDEWQVVKELAWDSKSKRVLFLSQGIDVSDIDSNNVVYYRKYSQWATMYMELSE
tara:strand:+ start:4210 stop:4407 length:198 start_codon:yes stop_codon:yes gene_type:complete